jgi:DnaJ-class molecular chaperone
MANCNTCNGKGSVKCPKCKGTGEMTTGMFGNYQEKCNNCHGSGVAKCGVCNGSGKL